MSIKIAIYPCVVKVDAQTLSHCPFNYSAKLDEHSR